MFDPGALPIQIPMPKSSRMKLKKKGVRRRPRGGDKNKLMSARHAEQVSQALLRALALPGHKISGSAVASFSEGMGDRQSKQQHGISFLNDCVEYKFAHTRTLSSFYANPTFPLNSQGLLPFD